MKDEPSGADWRFVSQGLSAKVCQPRVGLRVFVTEGSALELKACTEAVGGENELDRPG